MKWIVAGVLLLCVGGFAWFFFEISRPLVLPDEGLTLTVTPGERTADIVDALGRKGVIPSTAAFKIFLLRMQARETIKAGEYTFRGVVTIPSVARQLVSGSPKSEKNLRIIEGWTQAQIIGYLEKEGIETRERIEAALARDWSARFPFLTQGRPLEGYLFPDTYRVYQDARVEDVIEKMLANFDRKVTSQMRSRLADSGMSLHAAVTLASIVEREVRSDDDRANVADLFNRRLRAKMPLQADSTVNYATGKSSPSASAVDLLVDSPYNTYKYHGLPPGPIANPGLSALKAVVSPKNNPYWYFLTPKDGSVIYARTFEEQVRNKRKYLRNQ
ncbi:endolytic transglycosylase MltG [Candidatus Uhrbacteria bacterium]|nr:endolytic transglycosylase MltG [Candidatus Uhrbacteria bacterium]